jgi:hypothetical protein
MRLISVACSQEQLRENKATALHKSAVAGTIQGRMVDDDIAAIRPVVTLRSLQKAVATLLF